MKPKSILRQLKKYQDSDQTPAVYEVPDWDTSVGIDLWAIARQIARTDDYQEIGFDISFPDRPNREITHQAIMAAEMSMNDLEALDLLTANIYKKLQNMPIMPGMEKLYPVITMARYHLGYNHQYPTSEERCDKEITDFMQSIDIDEYKKKFLDHCDELTRKIVLSRALLATFEYGDKRPDNLSPEHRTKICVALGVSTDITVAGAARFQDDLAKVSNIEQQILGRFGYMMLWNWITAHGTDQAPLLTSTPPRLGHSGA